MRKCAGPLARGWPRSKKPKGDMGGNDGTLRIVRAGTIGVILLGITGCATTPASRQGSGSAENVALTDYSQVDYTQNAAPNEGLEARVARLEHDLAQLRIDYSVVRPDMERIVARDGSVEYRVSAIEEALGFATGSISPSTPRPQAEPSQAKPSAQSPPPSAGITADATPYSGPETAIVPPAPSPSPPALAPNYGVHLASYRDEAGLQEGWRELRAVNPDLLKGLEPQVRLVDTGKDGVYRRLIAGPVNDKAAADHLCAALKDRGTWCQPLPLAAE